MNLRRAFAALVFIVLCIAVSAGAATFVMPSDARFADASPVIIDGHVLDVSPSPVEGTVATDYLVSVNEVVKGFVSGSAIIVRVPGGERADGSAFHLFGAPTFRRGEKTLLFLGHGGDGTYRVQHLMLGAFHKVPYRGQVLAVRNLEEARNLDDAKDPAPRDYKRFSRWLSDRGRGIVREADYLVDRQASGRHSTGQRYTFFKAFGNRSRWFAFDRGETVPFFFDPTGWNGSAGGRQQVRDSLAVWNDDPASNVNFNFAGNAASDGALFEIDDVTGIVFDDPFDDIEGSFICGPGGGGVLASATYASTPPLPFKGKNYRDITEGNIVVQDGTDCFFRNRQDLREGVFAHEIGHVLGLGHSCEQNGKPSCDDPIKDDALMRWAVHEDGRGAVLSSDDRAALDCLYGSGSCKGGGGGGGGNTSSLGAPSKLTANVRGGGNVDLSWTDNATEELNMVVQMSSNGGVWDKIATLGADSTEFTVTGLSSGSYSFRVRAKAGNDRSQFSNEVTVSVP